MTRVRPAWHRLGAMLLCLVFVCAFYGSLTVQAVFGVDDIVIGGALVASAAALTYITVIGLSGSDLAEPLYDAANRANTDINDWLEPKVEAFLQATDGTTLLETQINSLVNGLSYGKDGVLYFSDALGDYIHDFGEWLIDNGDIVIDSSGDLVLNTYNPQNSDWNLTNPSYFTFPVSFSGNSVDFIASTEEYHAIATGSDEIYSFTFKWGNYIYNPPIFISTSSFTVTSEYRYLQYGNWKTETSTYSPFAYTIAGTRYYGYRGGSGKAFDEVSAPVNVVTGIPDISDVIKLFYNQEFSSTGATNGLDVWNQDTTDGFAVDPTGVIGGSIADADVPAGAIAGVGDYVQAIADAIAGIADITLPVAGVGDIPIDPAIPADISIPVTPAIPADVADAVPATGEATPAYPATGDYTLPLGDFFPFCIPFDLYKMLSLLAASPEAPAFTWQFYTPGGGSIPIEVDLSAFDSVAAVLRAVETLAFCVGLGFVTKKLLFGS